MDLLWLCIFACLAFFVEASELTFELPDNAKQCFYEDVDKGVKTSLEFQVCKCVKVHQSQVNAVIIIPVNEC